MSFCRYDSQNLWDCQAQNRLPPAWLTLPFREISTHSMKLLSTQIGWRRSPLYDVHPVPYGEDLALNVNEDDSAISFDLAIEAAQYYGISQKEAEKIVNEISTTVRGNWERLANGYGLSRGNIDKCNPLFPPVVHNRTPSFCKHYRVDMHAPPFDKFCQDIC